MQQCEITCFVFIVCVDVTSSNSHKRSPMSSLDIGAKDELEETMNVRLWEMINARIYNNMNNRTKE